jgi:hypothetical protein
MEGIGISGTSAPTATTQPASKDTRRGLSSAGSASGERGSLVRSTGKAIAGYESVPRARRWSEEVEDLYRLQYAGWRDEEEYRDVYGEVQRHSDAPHFISTTRLKGNGYYVYWRKHRELEDKHVGRVKLYGMGDRPEAVSVA